MFFIFDCRPANRPWFSWRVGWTISEVRYVGEQLRSCFGARIVKEC